MFQCTVDNAPLSNEHLSSDWVHVNANAFKCVWPWPATFIFKNVSLKSQILTSVNHKHGYWILSLLLIMSEKWLLLPVIH